MINFYFGSTRNPAMLVSRHNAYTLEDEHGNTSEVPQRYLVCRKIKRLFGFSLGQSFVGIMTYAPAVSRDE
jgi:hypothetical protein